MKIIEQSHEILSYDSLDLIERAGRTCYKSEDKIGCVLRAGLDCTYVNESVPEDWLIGPVQNEDGTCAQSDCLNHSAVRFTRQLIRRGHEAMLEHGKATVKFITNRGVAYEFIRHRPTSEDQNPSAFIHINPALAQESTRYVKYNNVEFIKPVWVDLSKLPEDLDDVLYCYNEHGERTPEIMWALAMRDAEAAYCSLIGLGWLPEQAREVLTNSLKTELVVTANYREWRHILKLRALGTAGRPHPQMQALMLPLLSEFVEKLPALFEDLELPR